MSEAQQDLHEVTVSLIPQAKTALDAVVTRGLSTTDAINRAVQLYDFIETEIEAGWELRLWRPDGTFRTVEFL